MIDKHVTGLVSVSIVTWNSWPLVRECLESLFRQTYNNFEVLLVDNASQDGTAEQILKNYPQIAVIKNARNEGFSKAHNLNIRKARGEYVLLLNPDVILADDFLKTLVGIANEEPQVGAFSGLLLRQDGIEIDSAGIGFSRWKRVFDDCKRLPIRNDPIFGASGAAALYRRTMLEDIREGNEYFDEMFFAYYEDVDLAWRAQSRGWSARCVPGAKGRHLRQAAQSHGGRHVQPLIFRNRYWTLTKNELAGDFCFHLPMALIFESLRWMKWLFTTPQVFAQIPTLIRSGSRILNKRKAIRLRRTITDFSPNRFPIR